MMKRLHLRCSARGDALSTEPGDLQTASLEGSVSARRGVVYSRLFCSNLRISCETSVAFSEGYKDPLSPEPIEKLGNGEVWRLINTPEFAVRRARGADPVSAFLGCFDADGIEHWGRYLESGIIEIFGRLGRDELGMAWGHSPLIELACWQLRKTIGRTDDMAELKNLGSLEGVVLIHDEHRIHVAERKIEVQSAINA